MNTSRYLQQPHPSWYCKALQVESPPDPGVPASCGAYSASWTQKVQPPSTTPWLEAALGLEPRQPGFRAYMLSLPSCPRNSKRAHYSDRCFRAWMPPSQWLLHPRAFVCLSEGMVVSPLSVHRVGLVHSLLGATVGSTAQTVQEGQKMLAPWEDTAAFTPPSRKPGKTRQRPLKKRDFHLLLSLSVLSLRKE